MKKIIKKITEDVDNNGIDDEKKYFLFHEHRFKYLFSLLEKYDKSKSVLDIGAHCLHGLLGIHYLGFKNIFGTDLNIFNSTTTARAKQINAIIKNCDLESEAIPFPDQSFDIVLFTETLEHFNFHPKKIFTEIARVLKPNGIIIITTPNLLRLNNRLKMILGKSINQDISRDYTFGSHYREYSAHEIECLLNLSGLNKESLKFVDFDYPDRGLAETIINKVLGFMIPGLKTNLVIIGKKE